MLRQPTIDKLETLKLSIMAKAWLDQDASPDTQAMAFDDRFGMVVDAEHLARENKRLVRNLKEARLRISDASVEGIEYPARRQLDRALVRQLIPGHWVTNKQVITITGPTGTGKTYLGCALAHQACRIGHRAVYRRVNRLFDELKLARADGTYARAMARFAKTDVLLLDDFGLAPMTDADRRDLLELIEDRHGLKATIITSQLPPDTWHDYIGDPTVADAICDRLLHGAHRIAIKGPSMRDPKSKKKDKGEDNAEG
jgi:DNA replication protein DnaC